MWAGRCFCVAKSYFVSRIKTIDKQFSEPFRWNPSAREGVLGNLLFRPSKSTSYEWCVMLLHFYLIFVSSGGDIIEHLSRNLRDSGFLRSLRFHVFFPLLEVLSPLLSSILPFPARVAQLGVCL